MHLFAGLICSVSMMVLPVVLQLDLSKPPVNLTGWLVFAISLGGVLSMVSILMTKLIINPSIQAQLATIPSRKEFDAHVESDKQFHNRVDGFIENYYQGDGIDRRHVAGRRGDPQ